MSDRKRGKYFSKMQLVLMGNEAIFVFLGGLLTWLSCLKEKQQIQQLQQIQL